jgi:hypothetical protein
MQRSESEVKRMPKGVYGALGWGTVLIAGVVGALVALAQDVRPYPVVVALGICITLMTIVWQWWRGRYRAEIRKMIGDPSWGLYLFLLVASVALQGLWITGFVISHQQIQGHPCTCFQDQRGREWLDVVLWAGILSWLELITAFASFVSLYRLIRGRPVPE